jgi:tetratricopeptide (TPR) repeat protein
VKYLKIGVRGETEGSDHMRNQSDDESQDSSDQPNIGLFERIEKLYQAGMALESSGALELAGQNYRQALNLVAPEEKENFKALHYRLGRVAEALGNLEEAEEHYIAVAGSD